MQIVIPMSGFGERFRKAGYTVPKPLIDIDGRPIISYVIEMFPNADSFIFICNEDHLLEPIYRMAQVLREYAPNSKIVSIAPHHLGPVHAVLQAADVIDRSKPTIVNYCDFTCYWDFSAFTEFVEMLDCDGAIPAYKGFHPHSLGSTYYAYMQNEGLWVSNIREKQPFTECPMEEYASSGTYYFKSGALCLDTFAQQISRPDLEINSEYYASLAYRVMLEQNLKVCVFPLQHFMQWGTPQDLEIYKGWSEAFRQLATHSPKRARHSGAIVVPMAGLGKRFSDEGYELPKPLIPVSGRPMVIQAAKDLPDAPIHRFVLRRDLPLLDKIAAKLRSSFVGTELVYLDGITEGQAITTLEGLKDLDQNEPVTIGACDNGLLFDVERFNALMNDPDIDIFVWTTSGHAEGKTKPEMFGWVETNDNGNVTGTSIKKMPNNPETDAMIVGTFTFKRTSDYIRCVTRLLEQDRRVNNEFYVDSLIEDALSLDLRVKIFDIDNYVGWGTPDDLKTFQYWQSCFHKWGSHPYTLNKDVRIPTSNLQEIEAQCRKLSVREMLDQEPEEPSPSLNPLNYLSVLLRSMRSS
jgi:NDP-sugar pyrophosphorylase family protein